MFTYDLGFDPWQCVLTLLFLCYARHVAPGENETKTNPHRGLQDRGGVDAGDGGDLGPQPAGALGTGHSSTSRVFLGVFSEVGLCFVYFGNQIHVSCFFVASKWELFLLVLKGNQQNNHHGVGFIFEVLLNIIQHLNILLVCPELGQVLVAH